MKIFIDSANLDEIRRAKDYGLMDGVTTNPTLLAKEGGDWKKKAKEICKFVSGPVSLEVVSMETEGMLKEARELVKFGPNVVIKIPMTLDGLRAVKRLKEQDIPTNVTLIFSANQALLAAKAGANYISPFIGRLDAIGSHGLDLVSHILTIFDQYGFDSEVIVASIRHPEHVLESALLGAHIATIPFSVLPQLAYHPLTDTGIESFLKDWKKVQA